MIEEVLPNIYRIELPLPRNPLKAINCYVIKARSRNLIVDTGMNREECRTALQLGLRELEIDLGDTDLFLTHMHADHSGLAGQLAPEVSKVYCSQPDADILSSGSAWEAMQRFAALSGFPLGDLQQAIEKHPGYRYGSRGPVEFTLLGDGDTITLGDYSFRCVATPGHTRGHTCLYEPNLRLLVAGDHVLHDITPNISVWSDEGNPLEQYLGSLDKVCQLDVDLVLPGHRRVFRDHRERIRELKHHHQVRADEVLTILEEGAMNAFQVASRMTWDMSYDSFEQFPVSQKWFAAGEAVAHLKYLEEKGLVLREMRDQGIFFSRSPHP